MVDAVALLNDKPKKLKKRIERLIKAVLNEVSDDNARIEITSKLVEIRRLLDGERADN